MMHVPRLCAIVPLCLVALAIRAQQPAPGLAPQDPRFAAAEAEAAARSARIRDEITGSGAIPGWAGSYYHGNGTGVNVTVDLAPRSGFVFTWRGCLGICDRNYGTCTEKDGRIELAFTFANVREGARGLAPVLVPVQWGERCDLIASEQLVAFANDVNGGSEPREAPHGRALLRSGDEKKPAKVKPELPKEIAAMLLDEPVTGMLVAMHETRKQTRDKVTYRVSEATIDRGTQHGLRKGHVVHFRLANSALGATQARAQ